MAIIVHLEQETFIKYLFGLPPEKQAVLIELLRLLMDDNASIHDLKNRKLHKFSNFHLQPFIDMKLENGNELYGIKIVRTIFDGKWIVAEIGNDNGATIITPTVIYDEATFRSKQQTLQPNRIQNALKLIFSASGIT